MSLKHNLLSTLESKDFKLIRARGRFTGHTQSMISAKSLVTLSKVMIMTVSELKRGSP